YCCDVDHDCHIHGLEGNHYPAAGKRVDAHAKALTPLISVRKETFAADWPVTSTTDHGHVDEGDHGGDTARAKETWVIAWSPEEYTPDWEKELRPEEITPLILREREA